MVERCPGNSAPAKVLQKSETETATDRKVCPQLGKVCAVRRAGP